MRELSILGAIGSIGTQALEVLRRHPGRIKVRAIAAARSVEPIVAMVDELEPELVAMMDPEAAGAVRSRIGARARVVTGLDGLVEAATLPGLDLVLAATVGAVGLPPVYAALERGTDIALANKEVLVAGGEAVIARARQSGAKLLPVDSEHSALFQALGASPSREVRSLWLTASGGPFRGRTRAELSSVTVAQALKHPNWSMGAKITVDSATLMNKGLEVIEAHWLFGIDYDRIRVVLHPQSIIHSLVEYVDGSWLAQMGVTDMKIPIQYALSFPDRWDAPGVPDLGITRLRDLSFGEPDPSTFECLALAYAAGRKGKTFPCVLNAANEVANEAFREGRIGFLDIGRVVREVLDRHEPRDRCEYQDVLAADAWARDAARTRIEAGAGT